MAYSFAGVGIGISYDAFEYSLMWLIAFVVAGCTLSSFSWLAWKRWGRAVFPLRAKPAAE